MTRSRSLVWALTALGIAIGIVFVPLLAESGFIEHRGLWIALNLLIGWGFVGAGAFAWLRRPENRTGPLMVLTGFAWYMGVAAYTEPDLLYTIGIFSNNLFAGTAIHLVLAFPSGRLQAGFDRALVLITYFTVTVGIFVPTLFYDPAAYGCATCPQNLALIEAEPAFNDAWFDGIGVFGIAVLLVVIGRLVVRWRAASHPMRRAITPVFVSGAVLMVTLAILLGAYLFDASYVASEVIFYAALASLGAVPYVFLAGLVRARMIRGGAVGSLVATLGEPLGPGGLRDALARALGDPSVDLAFWLPDSGQHVDARGRVYELPAPGAGRAAHEVALDGHRVAAIVHDATLLEDPELIDTVGAAAALALERERLQAELRAKVEELSDSRARMLKFGMAERRRLERDLHDGAQQRLVSLALDLRLARDRVRSDPAAAEELLQGAADELAEALEELRELARGIHPALLSDRGLGPAIEALGRRAPLPVAVNSAVNGRAPESVELAAYFVVSEALTNIVKYARATNAEIRVASGIGFGREILVVEVSDDGVGGAELGRGSGLRGLADRISSLGGQLDVDSAPGAGTTIRARIPYQ